MIMIRYYKMKGLIMELKYELNLELYEIYAMLSNFSRWKGQVALREEIKKYQTKLHADLYSLLEYGVLLISSGYAPEFISFLLDAEVDEIVHRTKPTYNQMKDIKLTVQFIKWFHIGDRDTHQVLLKTLKPEVNGQYRNWVGLNEFKLDLTFEESKNLETEDWFNIRDANSMVKNYYENRFNQK